MDELRRSRGKQVTREPKKNGRTGHLRGQISKMLVTAPDCVSTAVFFYSKKLATPTLKNGVCRASLITRPDSFEVGRLISSYGYMNITRFTLISFIQFDRELR